MKLTDHHRTQRAEFLANPHGQREPLKIDPYEQKRSQAVAHLRARGRYALDRGSAQYIPANGHTPQAIVPMRTSL